MQKKKKKIQGSMLTQNGAEIYTIIKVENYTFTAVPCIAVKWMFVHSRI